jgi:hypothetical protein
MPPKKEAKKDAKKEKKAGEDTPECALSPPFNDAHPVTLNSWLQGQAGTGDFHTGS